MVGGFSMTVDEILEEIIKLAIKYDIGCVILTGSYAKGTFTRYSDIDIAVKGAENIDKFEEDIDDLPTLHSIDIINLDTCNNKFLLEDIKKYGKQIY